MFTQHIAKLRTLCEALTANPEAGSPMGRLVCAGIAELTARAEEFDAVVSHELHFKKHFLQTVTSLYTPTLCVAGEIRDGGLIQELFEDLALFARTRSLVLGMGGISEAERAILHHFETSGHWPEDDEGIVAQSYWHELPEQQAATH